MFALNNVNVYGDYGIDGVANITGPSFNEDLNSWNVSSLVNMDYMFYENFAYSFGLCSWRNSLSQKNTSTQSAFEVKHCMTWDLATSTNGYCSLCDDCAVEECKPYSEEPRGSFLQNNASSLCVTTLYPTSLSDESLLG